LTSNCRYVDRLVASAEVPFNDMSAVSVGIRGHMGHIGILVVVVRRLSRRWKVKTLLAGPSPTSPMKAKITISPISNSKDI